MMFIGFKLVFYLILVLHCFSFSCLLLLYIKKVWSQYGGSCEASCPLHQWCHEMHFCYFFIV